MIYGLSFLAGMISTLSPCVLPVLPLIVGSAIQKNRLGPLYLSIGMVLSFSTFGLVFAVGVEMISIHILKMFGASVMIAGSLFLMIPRLSDVGVKIFSPIANLADRKQSGAKKDGIWQFIVTGIMFGALWAPCTGPTLGIAIGMAARSETQIQSLLLFVLFGIGAAVPLLLIAYSLRNYFDRHKSSLISFGEKSKVLFGWTIFIVGTIMLFNIDKTIESMLINVLPDWWVHIISMF